MAHVERFRNFITQRHLRLCISEIPPLPIIWSLYLVLDTEILSTREFFGCVVLECLMHIFILFHTISAFKSIFPFFFFYPPNLLLFQRHSSESIQLSGRLLYINAECICAKGATETKLKKMS